MTSRKTTKVPALFGLVAGLALACSGVDHPPPVGSGGRSQPMPPVIVEFGGTNTGGATGQAGSISASGSLSDNFAGNATLAGSAGDTSSAGSTSLAGTATNGGAGDGVAGTVNTFGGTADGLGDGLGGTFSSGGL